MLIVLNKIETDEPTFLEETAEEMWMRFTMMVIVPIWVPCTFQLPDALLYSSVCATAL